MTQTISLPLWLFVLIVLFAAVTFASHFLFPSVRWFFRRRVQRAVTRLNQRLARPIEPFKLARRHDMIQRLIYDPEVTREIVAYARKYDVPENVAFEQARRYAREIVPSFSAMLYFSFGTRMARMLVNSIYEVWTGPRNDEVIRGISPDATVVFIMNHRSNMDYVLVTYLAARTSTLSYAVGEWARVWPLSQLIRMMGAYFIRRRSRGALYRRVLARYVQMAMAGGVTQGIFPEGGLSLTGAIMPPKLGLLSYLRDGYDPDGRDIVFVPVAINYDRILEDRVLIAAGARGDRRFGARITVVVGFILRKFWQGLRGRYKRFGTAAVVFGAPLSLRAFGPERPVEELAGMLMRRLEADMPALIVPILCTLLEKGRVLGTSEMQAQAAVTVSRLDRHVPMKVSGTLDAEVSAALEQMRRHRMVEKTAQGWQTVPGEEAVVAYYARSVTHHLKEQGRATG